MKRRTFLAGSAAALAAPRIGRAADGGVLKVIPEGDLPVVDPVWTTATVAHRHGFMVFDTLYGQDADFNMQPQMVDAHVVENDGKLWTITLRDGLKFHDGEPVRARDVVPSIRRFAARDAYGRSLMDATDELSVVSDKVFRFRLKKRFPRLPNALGKTATPMPAMMPERLALTDPDKQIPEVIGSGPFRFNAKERVPGSLVVYEKFEGYVPRPDGPATFTAGPKIVHFDRVEWHVVPDKATAANALINGEVEWWQNPDNDLLNMLRNTGKLTIEVLDPAGGIAILRFNQLYPPFDNAAIRRALLGTIDQEEYMLAASGEDRSLFKTGVSVFSPGTPMDSKLGLEAIANKPDFSRVKRALAEAGYKGERVVILGASDYPQTNALALLGADALSKAGMTVDFQAEDWGTTVQRRASRQPPDKGGWNIFPTTLNGPNTFDPAGHLGIRGNGKDAWFGWPNAPRLEELRAAWFDADTIEEQKRICQDIQRQFFIDVPYMPLGCVYGPTAYSKRLTGVRTGFMQLYDVRRV
jgi:peptide/nickel transport system substrate-binding protein